jgi:amidase
MPTLGVFGDVLDGGGQIEAVASTNFLALSGPGADQVWSWEELPGGESVRLLADWDAFRTGMLAFMESVDIIVCPTAPGPAALHGEGLETIFHYTLPFSLTGQPCVVVPSGRSGEGLPIGVQVVSRVWREDVAIAAARHIEATIGGWRRPPI